jgi:hypothetical protein
MYTIQLARDDTGRYAFPNVNIGKTDYYFSVMGFAVFRNGLLMTPGFDYSVEGLWIIPLSEWGIDDTISALVSVR